MDRLRGAPDPYANEPLGGLRGQPVAFTASDGVQLHVEVDGGVDPGLTVVFVHGYLLNQDSWHFQRLALREVTRLVFYDQRSHGRSGRAARDQTSMLRLGTDLGELLDALVPPGPVVLVGHSMGGMAIMSLADQRPELFGDRVVGVGLLATSSAIITGAELGLYGRFTRLLRRYGPPAAAAAAARADLLDSVKQVGGDLGYLLVRRSAFGDSEVPPSLVQLVTAMVVGTPAGVSVPFLPHLGQLDVRTALAVLGSVPTLVIGSGRDHITPVEHSRDIVAAIPAADYVEIPGSGHMVMLEHPDLVTAHIRALVARATRGTAHEVDHPGAVPVPLPRRSRRQRGARARRP